MTQQRVVMGVEYNGARYFGWQVQRDQPKTLQAVLEQAISRVGDETIRIHAAGRTDRRVHAQGQVIHFDTHSQRDLHAWVFGANHFLPEDVVVLWACWVDDGFHARYQALSRTYCYTLVNRASRPALHHSTAAWCRQPLAHEDMHKAAQCLLGEQDFSSFRASKCQSRSPMRCVHEVRIERIGECVFFWIRANAFLYHMVRNIVGSLIQIGTGEKPPAWMTEVLTARTRSAAGMTAAPQGLSLVDVRYPASYALPEGFVLTEKGFRLSAGRQP